MNHKGPYLLDLSSTLLIHDISFVHCVDFKLGNALGHWDLDDLESIIRVQKALLGEQVCSS